MKENKIEAHLRKRVKERGGEHRKVTYQGRNGALDDWCFFPGGLLLIVECKRLNRTSLDPLQEVEMEWLTKMGFTARFANSIESVDEIISDFFGDLA